MSARQFTKHNLPHAVLSRAVRWSARPRFKSYNYHVRMEKVRNNATELGTASRNHISIQSGGLYRVELQIRNTHCFKPNSLLWSRIWQFKPRSMMSKRTISRMSQIGTIGRNTSHHRVSQTMRFANTSTAATIKPSVDANSSTAAKPGNPFELGSRRTDFKKAEALRPTFDSAQPVTVSQTPDPDWKYGKGINDTYGQQHEHIEIDPYAEDRAMISNYKLLVSGIPRPISFVSTVSKNGHRNLSPMSYFQVVDHDPPIFVVGFSARASRPKDTKVNLNETGECVISVVTEHMIEAVNATSIDVPYGTSEWELSGLESAPSSTVRPERVKDAVFSIEGRLLEMKELDYGGKHAKEGKPSGALAIIEATRFWVRQDALSKGKDEIDLATMKPLIQLGGISYGRVKDTFELPRPRVQEELEDEANGLRRILDTQNS